MTRVEAFVPAVGWLRQYDRGWLSHDVVGGLAAGAVVIPRDSFLFEVDALLEVLDDVSWTTAAFSAGTLAVLLLCGGWHRGSRRRWSPSPAASCWSRWPTSTSTDSP